MVFATSCMLSYLACCMLSALLFSVCLLDAECCLLPAGLLKAAVSCLLIPACFELLDAW
jgi:hypothetical protein